jgi:hypothetical protein
LIRPTSSTPVASTKNEAEAAERVATEMHEVEGAAGVAGLGAIMNHRRHDQAVFQGQPASGEGWKSLGWPSGCRSVHRSYLPCKIAAKHGAKAERDQPVERI